MKKSIFSVLLLLFSASISLAQVTVTPSQINQPLNNSQSLTAQPGKNYIRTYTYLDGVDTAYTKLYSTNIDIQYFDGLGRQEESVSVKASPAGSDIVALQTYDSFGRAETTYLPYASATTGGIYVPRTSVISALPAYLGSNFDLIGADNQYGFSRPKYEDSPLNRVLQQGAPGAEWQPDTVPAVHTVQFEYQTNTSSIVLWKYNGNSYTAYTEITYAANSLYVTQTTDEDGKKTRSYTDFEGKVVMKESYDGTNWLKTRYCYDYFGQLRCVLQPLATDPGSTEYCFYYIYDDRCRLTEKKIPGSGWEYMVYDARDRLALTSDENSRAFSPPLMRWYYNKYDDLNRTIE